MASAAVTPERHDTVALAWTKAAILDCLGQARQALERFAGEPGDLSILAFVVDNLHQVHGCLRMLELRGAAHLAEELELLARALAEGQVSPRGECLGAVFRGLEQLPSYLERLRGARHDLPLVMLPLLNQLRTCRGVGPLAQGSLIGGAAERFAGADDLANLDLSLGNWREQMQAGPGRDALRSVVTALCDDLMRIKERLDHFVRGDRQHSEQLEDLLAPLRHVADTLAVLGFQQPRRVIIDQVLALQALALGERAADDAVLMDVAGALLYVEATLNGMVGPLEEGGQGGLPGSDLAEIRQLVLSESLSVVQQAKDLIGDCLESGWPRQRLQPLPGLLQQVRGALSMLMLPVAAEVFAGCASYVQGWLQHLDVEPPADELTHLAEALSAAECYLQWRVADPLADGQPFIDMARASLAALGVQCTLVETGADSSAGSDGIDDELRQVFLEEAGELLPDIERHWLRWRADNHLREALIEVRRALHTLKGSGRMVHAEAVAELAWGAEHLLNRVLEGRIALVPEAVVTLQRVFVHLPDLLADFAAGQLPQLTEIEQLASHLHVLAENDAPASTEVEGLDPQLLDIFRNEAQGHLACLDSFLQEAAGHDTPVSDALQRALHTLKGSAAMAGVMPIAELATAFDRLVREYKGHQLPLQVAELQWLEAARTLFHLGLAQLGSTPLAAIAGAAQLIEQVGQRVDERLATLHEDPQHGRRSKRDPQLIASFLGQGMDILLDAESLLSRWQEHPGQRQELDTLLDELTTLGHGAHLADLWQMDDVCEALLDLYGAVEEGSLVADARFFAQAQQAHEALLDMLDEVAAGQEVTARPERIDALRSLLAEALAPDATGLVGRDSVKPLPPAVDLEDPALAQLFLEEARDILDSADQALEQWGQEPDNLSTLSSLQHDMQTLKGAAQMAAVGAVERLAQELGLFYEALVDRRLGSSTGLIALLRRGHAALGEMLDTLRQGQPPSSAVDLLGEMREVRHAPPPPSSEAIVEEADSPGDKELLEVFLEESSDIVESAAEALARWQADPRSSVEVDNLLRDLHTLKGGARMVEIAAIGDLAHELEFLYELLAAGRLPPSPPLFALLQNCHDRLAHMLDAVRLGQPLHAATALIDYIRNFSSAALTDSAAGQAPADATPAEAPATTPERAAGDMVKVDAELLDELGNLAGEHSVIRGRIEQQVNDAQFALNEMETTLERMRDQLLRLDIETQGRISSRQQIEGDAYDDFDPLEMDRHSQLQQLSRALFESASDLLDLKETLAQRAQEAYSLLQQQARVASQLQEGLTATLMVPFERLVPRLQRVVRQVATELGKQVELVVGNAEGELDRSVLERMVAPLEHMLRNAVDHGLESREARLAAGKPEQGTIHLNLLHEGADIVIEMTDDGAGVPLEAVRRKAIKRGLLDPQAQLSDHEILQFILRPGFSTAEKITQISGRGLGMDVVHEEVKQLGGSMSIESAQGKGARFLIRLPFTVSINRALMVHLGEEQYAIPLNTIEGIVRVPPAELDACYQLSSPRYVYAGHAYELRYLGELLQGVARPSLLGQSVPLPVLLVHSQEQSFAIQVDSLSPSREIVVKSLGPQFAAVAGLSGATLLGDGRVVLILDLLGQLRGQQRRLARLPGGSDAQRQAFGPAPRRALLVMVVDDSVTVRKVTSRLLERHGMSVLTAKDGVDAMTQLEEHRPDVLLLDIEMPRMDGFEVATRIRRDERLKDLPIIMITSRTGQKHRDRAMAIGVNEYLGKPYQESVLLQSIAHWSQTHA
ncbi:hybrid sensor histidine kinase/response regulator [Pseudomonas sp. SWI6]|uniref:Hpt domain-containing protein n=1 Tax=Pseudomonas TaxID=286 RepID=UPI000400AC34|nr:MULTISPECIES: Hpt domain-containing protein [Pseudomonas]AVD85156.1 hybrid sensor histidine kinase/response regulator [Pseudomonas sp. SWI6]MDT8926231.1 Hpt domain-containing protein [Pseudomonas taiwanensis]QQZ36745.1 Hpt domain-containing protein [Pseudomonas sp. SK2]